jgi:hypothetical protein
MIGLAQLNLQEVPSLPQGMRGLAFVTLFLSEEDDGLAIPDEHPNGSTVWLRCTRPPSPDG